MSAGGGAGPPARGRRIALAAAAAAAVALYLLRLVHLEADFPHRLTWSHALYTDEGWYSTAAIRSFLRAEWFLAGDMNNAVAVPLFQIVQAINFQLAGMSLWTARLPGVLLFGGLVAVSAGWLWRRDEPTGAAVAALLLTGNFHLFAYSRIAFLELPMTFFVVAAFYLASAPAAARAGAELGRGAAAGACLAAAVMTKGSALFALPALAPLFGFRWRAWRWRAAGFAAGAAVPLAGWWAVARHHQADWVFYWSGVVAGAMEDADYGPPARLARRAWLLVRAMLDADPLLVIAVAIAVAGLLVRWRSVLGDRVVLLLLALQLCYAGALCATGYRPTRYLLPLFVLSILTVGAALSRFLIDRRRVLAALLIAAAAAGLVLDLGRVASYLARPEHSYRAMCDDVRRRLAGLGDRAVLMGDGALQIALATGVWAVNGTSGTESLAWRLARYRPTHYVSTGPVSEAVRRVLADGHAVEVEATYDVFDNYFNGEPVHLYRLTPVPRSRQP